MAMIVNSAIKRIVAIEQQPWQQLQHFLAVQHFFYEDCELSSVYSCPSELMRCTTCVFKGIYFAFFSVELTA